MGFNYHSKTVGGYSDQQFSCHGKSVNVEGNSDQQFSCHGKLGNVGGNSDQQFSSHVTLAMPIPKSQVGYNGCSTD